MSCIRGRVVTAALAASCAMAYAPSAHAQFVPVDWDVDNALAIGNACNSTGPFPTAFFIAAGEDISVLFTSMGANLTPASAVNTVVNACLIRIPVTVDREVKIDRLTQRVSWGYAKDFGTEAEVTSRGSFFRIPTSGVTEFVGTGVQGVNAFIASEVDDIFFQPGLFCGADRVGLLEIDLSVAARRNLASQDISVQIFGEDIRYEALADFLICP